jgi:hypothetical protein
MRKIFLLYLVIVSLFLVPTVISSEKELILIIDFVVYRESNQLDLDRMFVLRGDRVFDNVVEGDSFLVELYHDREGIVHSYSFDTDFIEYFDPPKLVDEMPMSAFLPFDKDAKEVFISRNGEEIFSYEINDKLCNLDGECNNFENYYSCEQDCPIGKSDGFCTSKSGDGLCDPDCGVDDDCDEQSVLVEEIKLTGTEEKVFPWLTVLLVILGLIVLVLLGFYIYHRKYYGY